jgi:hypothetical protein
MIFGVPVRDHKFRAAFSVVTIVLISVLTIVYFNSITGTNQNTGSESISSDKKQTKSLVPSVQHNENQTVTTELQETFDSMILNFSNRSFSNETSGDNSKIMNKKHAFLIIGEELKANGLNLINETDELMITNDFIFQTETNSYISRLTIMVDKDNDNKIRFDISKHKLISQNNSDKITIKENMLHSIIDNIKNKYHN